MGKVRVAIVGAGLMGRWHARYATRAGAAVVAVVDPNPTAAAQLAARHRGAAAFADLPAAVATKPDAVHLCTPLATHVSLAEKALAAGCHVLCEKPLAGSRAETERLLALAEKHGRQLCAVHQFGFQRGVRQVRDRLPRLGELVEVAYRTCTAGGDCRPPAGRRALLLEILPHPVSLFVRLLGAEAGQLDWRVGFFSDDDLCLDSCAGNTRLRIEISLRGRPPRNELAITGTRGSASADLFHGYAVFEPGGTGRFRKALRPFAISVGRLLAAGGNLLRRVICREPAYPGLQTLIGDFYASLDGRTENPTGPGELLAVADLVDLVRESESPLPAVEREQARLVPSGDVVQVAAGRRGA